MSAAFNVPCRRPPADYKPGDFPDKIHVGSFQFSTNQFFQLFFIHTVCPACNHQDGSEGILDIKNPENWLLLLKAVGSLKFFDESSFCFQYQVFY